MNRFAKHDETVQNSVGRSPVGSPHYRCQLLALGLLFHTAKGEKLQEKEKVQKSRVV